MLWKPSIRLLGPIVASILLAVASVLGVDHIRPATAATIAYPDLQMMILTSNFSIGHPTSTTRELRFSHVTWNAGPGPMEIDPAYDPATNTAQGYQRLYTYDQSGQLTPLEDVPMPGRMTFVPPRQYAFPLASFTLYSTASNGSIGQPVAVSPKIQYCINDDHYVGGVPNTASGVTYVYCDNPSDTLGLSVGFGDEYDYIDVGENIDITKLPDGTYWLRAIANPDHYLLESDSSNNVTDTKLTVAGDTVTVLEQTRPDSTPPTVRLESPTSGASLSGVVTVSATASATTGIKNVQFLLDGQDLTAGRPLTSPPFTFNWDASQAAPGPHLLSVQATSNDGLVGSSSPIWITVPEQVGSLRLDQYLTIDGIGTVQTPTFSTTQNHELLLAFVATSVSVGIAPQPITVSGAGLTWKRVTQANSQPGDSEIWTATATSPLRDVAVTSMQENPDFTQSLVVLALQGAGGIGASGFASGPNGAPTVSLTTNGNGSWVLGVGNDYSGPAGRTLGPNQQMIHQWLDGTGGMLYGVGNTYWVQATSAPIATAGTKVTLDDGAPTADQWNFAAVEVLAAGNSLGATPTATPGGTPPALSSIFLPFLAVGGLVPSGTSHPVFANVVSPVQGEDLSGSVTLAAQTPDQRSLDRILFLLDGQPLGRPVTAAPFAYTWDTTQTSNGSHTLGVRTTDSRGIVSVSAPVTVSVTNPRPAMVCFITDVSTAKDGIGTLTTPTFHTSLPNELLIALAAAAGPSGSQQTLTITGAGLNWTLVKRANVQPGTAEVWIATAPTALANATVTATPSIPGYAASLNLLAIQEADGAGTASALSALSSAPTLSVRTTKAQSVVYGVGIESANAIAPLVGQNQILDHQSVDTSNGVSFWMQNWTSAAGSAGSTITLNAKFPSSGSANFAAVEIVSSDQ